MACGTFHVHDCFAGGSQCLIDTFADLTDLNSPIPFGSAFTSSLEEVSEVAELSPSVLPPPH
ncbi:hypothetical protein [Algoriphagus persicinus]|uniref:hypothetical protein n=1 Tax=Algoriphagus persicinus TaxID=3108754 RepID=UPI002B3C8D79|nr:hypothetical protein [Algoriphagus sp. E1-3-M2]MEB2780473.1 hypothetical protein [Algoriphagus sp. C2-6-M1]MEB2785361.1 hypothetical protein [Algoriphagus sp. E1-3-M2]